MPAMQLLGHFAGMGLGDAPRLQKACGSPHDGFGHSQ